MPELHFLRPWWLLAVPLGPLIVWRLRRYLEVGEHWRGVCDGHLLPHLLVRQGAKDATWAWRLMTIGLVLACVALAGPAWRRVELPVYRACLDEEGASGPADLALVGTEKEVEAGLARLRDAGATDFSATMFPSDGKPTSSTARSYEFFASLGGSI